MEFDIKSGPLSATGSDPRPAPDPTRETATRKDANLFVSTNPSPEPDNRPVTEARGENATAASGWETRNRGEDDRATVVTRTRGEGDGDRETKERGERASRADAFPAGPGRPAPDPRGTGTFSTDRDFNDLSAYESALDDPDDTRRITVLGALAARQEAARRP